MVSFRAGSNASCHTYREAFIVPVIELLVFAVFGIASYLVFNPRSQLFGTTINGVNTTEKVIAISFDDGPNGNYTEQVIDILNSYNAKGTFFVVTNAALAQKSIIKKMVLQKHQVGVHSVDHKFSKYFSQPFFDQELTQSISALIELGIEKPKIRTPWLFKSPFIFRTLNKLNQPYLIGGKFSHILEPFQISHKNIAKSCLRKIRSGDIIIFHDGYNGQPASRKETVLALEIVLAELTKKGYKFVTVDELLAGSENLK